MFGPPDGHACGWEMLAARFGLLEGQRVAAEPRKPNRNTRRLVNTKLWKDEITRARLEFYMAISGKVLCTLECGLPCSFDDDELRAHLELDVPFSVFEDKTEPLKQGLLIRRRRRIRETRDMTKVDGEVIDVIKVAVVCFRYKLVNARMDPKHPCGKPGQTGYRKWYKEFLLFAKVSHFNHPTVAVCDTTDERDTTDELNKVYACILQYKAAQFRYEAVCDYFLEHPEKIPLWHRWYPERIADGTNGRYLKSGCHHSIMRRSKAGHATVILFVDQWCDLNSDVLAELQAQIVADPFRTYFA